MIEGDVERGCSDSLIGMKVCKYFIGVDRLEEVFICGVRCHALMKLDSGEVLTAYDIVGLPLRDKKGWTSTIEIEMYLQKGCIMVSGVGSS